jgi:predicted ATPase/DNA-binding SARP family transcriptional activator
MTRLRFGVLGPLAVWRDGQPVRLGGGRQRSRLALLLVRANELVGVDVLVDALFGEQESEEAVHAVRVAVSRLRRLLDSGDEYPVLETRPGGYVLNARPEQLDAALFEQLLREGSQLLAGDQAAVAAARLREALALWRGPPLADLALVDFLQAEIRRLDELHLVALMERIDADLALGAGSELVADLEPLIAADPLQERLRGQLMLALCRAGRQADALAVYRELSGVLREELGLEPCKSLKELERSILQQDASLQPTRAAAASAPGISLPVPASPFVGRARELAELAALLQSDAGRLLTLIGAGGSGKTRLALMVAETLAVQYRDGAWFVGFADISDPELIIPTVCQALELAEQPDLTPERQLQAWLREREMLLVLDNLEQLTAGSAVLSELLAGCPGLTVLVTSREPLHLGGEQQYEVPVLDPADAIELFTSRARAVASRLNVEPELAGPICERLDRLPLAIELAAARTKVLSLPEILTRLERRLPVLASGPRDAPRRQRTLQATIDWSYELLTDEQQRLFTRLSVFAGGCTLQAAEAVAYADLDTVVALVDRSLLRADGRRYWMLQTLREYALEKLAQSGEEDHVRHSHAQWFVELLHVLGLDSFTDTGDTEEVLGAERENFRAALEWAERAGEIETVARLAAPLTERWGGEGRLSETGRWLGVARERSAEYPRALQATVLSAARELAWVRGAHQEAADLGELALAIYRELGNVMGTVQETISQASAMTALGDLRRSRTLMEEGLRLAREHRINRWLPRTLINLGDIEIAEGRLDQARAYCEEALTLAVRPGAGVAVRINLAHIANLEHRHADAAELAQEALDRAVAIGYLNAAAAAALMLAWSLAQLEQPELAAQLLGTALEFYHHTGTGMQWSGTVCEQATRDALEAQLDTPTLEALIDEGRTMPLAHDDTKTPAPLYAITTSAADA